MNNEADTNAATLSEKPHFSSFSRKRESSDLPLRSCRKRHWISAFAGMTTLKSVSFGTDSIDIRYTFTFAFVNHFTPISAVLHHPVSVEHVVQPAKGLTPCITSP